MVYHTDPRAGYGWLDFNVAWFYQMLDDRGEELIQNRSENGVALSEKELNHRESMLEKYIQRAVNMWIDYAVFNKERSKRIILYKEFDLSHYDSVYDVMYDVVLEFLDKYPTYYTLRNINDDTVGQE